MPVRLDLINKKFNHLTVIDGPEIRNGSSYWKCKCQCGIVKWMIGSIVKKAKSCGCLNQKLAALKSTTHGMTNTPLFKVWMGMKIRCYYDSSYYSSYGGKGIKVCKEWLGDFINFYQWAIKNRYKKGLQIDRKNNDGNYDPLNCRFITSKINNRNRSNTRMITYKSETKCLSEWCEILNVKYDFLYSRLRRMSVEKAFTKPIRKIKK